MEEYVTTVVIHVAGGNVQHVYSDDTDIRVVLVDDDNADDSPVRLSQEFWEEAHELVIE